MKLKESEEILFEDIGLFNEKEVNIILTNKRLVIERSRLLFKRKYINLHNIKKINGKYKIQLNNNNLDIQTNNKSYSISINDKKKMKNLHNQLYFALYGEYPNDKYIEGAKKMAIFAAPIIKKNSKKILNIFLKK